MRGTNGRHKFGLPLWLSTRIRHVAHCHRRASPAATGQLKLYSWLYGTVLCQLRKQAGWQLPCSTNTPCTTSV